jgi:hypothetical protein
MAPRRSTKRVIQSDTPSDAEPSASPELQDEVEEDEDEQDEDEVEEDELDEDAEGEADGEAEGEAEAEGEDVNMDMDMDVDVDAVGEDEVEDEDAEGESDEDELDSGGEGEGDGGPGAASGGELKESSIRVNFRNSLSGLNSRTARAQRRFEKVPVHRPLKRPTEADNLAASTSRNTKVDSGPTPVRLKLKLGVVNPAPQASGSTSNAPSASGSKRRSGRPPAVGESGGRRGSAKRAKKDDAGECVMMLFSDLAIQLAIPPLLHDRVTLIGPALPTCTVEAMPRMFLVILAMSIGN